MVGPEYEFLFVDAEMNGRNSDGGNWSQSRLKNGLEKKHIEFSGSNTPPWPKLSFTMQV